MTKWLCFYLVAFNYINSLNIITDNFLNFFRGFDVSNAECFLREDCSFRKNLSINIKAVKILKFHNYSTNFKVYT